MRTPRQMLSIVALSSALALIACKADTSGLATLSVPQLAAMLEEGGVQPCDANMDDTRAKRGIIPGAILLSSYRDYDVAGELPADKAQGLVFYCANEMCSSAPSAARKAVAAGYENVFVLPAGIDGWVEAKQPIQKAPASG